jgi:hypothetical protein
MSDDNPFRTRPLTDEEVQWVTEAGERAVKLVAECKRGRPLTDEEAQEIEEGIKVARAAYRERLRTIEQEQGKEARADAEAQPPLRRPDALTRGRAHDGAARPGGRGAGY